MSTAPAAMLKTPLDGVAFAGWDAAAAIAAPLAFHADRVRAEWTDYNGHMSESVYLLAFGHSTDGLFRYVGVDDAYRAAGHSLYTVETRIFNRAELRLGEAFATTLQLLDYDAKRLHLYHRMTRDDGALVAEAEQILVHVDMRAGRAAPMPGALAARFEAIAAAHAGLPRPSFLGRAPGLRGSGGSRP